MIYCAYEKFFSPDICAVRAALLTARDIAATEVNLAGGCASSEAWYHGADKQHVAYERVQETCVTTTWMRLCERLLAETDDPVWADYLERAFYNAYLGALKADGAIVYEFDIPAGATAVLELKGCGMEEVDPGYHVRHAVISSPCRLPPSSNEIYHTRNLIAILV